MSLTFGKLNKKAGTFIICLSKISPKFRLVFSNNNNQYRMKKCIYKMYLQNVNMRKNKIITTTINPQLISRLNMYAFRYKMQKNSVIELALSRLFETGAKAELNLTFKLARRDKGIRTFLKNIENDNPAPIPKKKVKQKEIFYADLTPRGKGGKSLPVPVVIISGDTINSRFGMSIVCPIQEKVKYLGGCVVLKKDKLNNLKNDSEILAFQVKTISHERLTKKIGEITGKQLAETIIWLRDILKW
jgi:mRNA-degrading endonuclease toxin of MazEF toxin-antitoxin module